MKFRIAGWAAVAAVVAMAWSPLSRAQAPGDDFGSPMAIAGELNKILGKHAAFTADMAVTSKPRGQESMKLKSPVAVREGLIRMELNLSQFGGGGGDALPPQLELLGIDRLVLVMNPEKKTGFLLVPALNAACKAAVKDFQSGAATAVPPKTVIEKRGLGSEEINGIRCAKKRVTVTEGKRVTTLTTWEASAPELQGVPIRSEMLAPDGTETVVLLSGIKMKTPPAASFVLPEKCRVYNTFQELMVSVLQTSLQKGRAPGR